MTVIVVVNAANAIAASKIARIVGSRANFIVTVFCIYRAGSEIELDRGPIVRRRVSAKGDKRMLAQRAITPISKIQKDSLEPSKGTEVYMAQQLQ